MQDLALVPSKSVLVVIDIQDKLLSAMPESAASRVVLNAGILLESAQKMGIPVIATEQYSKGLGKTAQTLSAHFSSDTAVIEKVEFDASANEDFLTALSKIVPTAAARSIVLVGMEAHICVYQTARGLRRRGFTVHVVADACSSRSHENEIVARGLWEKTGAVVTGTETVLFDWLQKAGTDHFKLLSKLVK